MEPPDEDKDKVKVKVKNKRRPIGATLTDMLGRERLDGLTVPEGKTVVEMLCESLMLRAVHGDLGCTKVVFERVEGRPRLAEPEDRVDARSAWDEDLDELGEAEGQIREQQSGSEKANPGDP